ncbi:MAG TPA: TIR domain-containing protein [Planctomycetota bacterium]|nr:TIR domain-containing protein [Planctomycetota bacterium]
MPDDATLKTRCPSCGTAYRVAATLAGGRARCGKCRAEFAVEAPATPLSEPAEAQTGYVFVCYSRRDLPIVSPIVEVLRQAGVRIWIDQEGIDGASFWTEEIVNAIRGCRMLMFMASENSVESPNTMRELALAAQRNVTILPIYLTPVELPARMEYQLAGIQYIELFEGATEQGLRAMFRALEHAGIAVPGAQRRAHVPGPSPVRPGASGAGGHGAPPLCDERAAALDPKTADLCASLVANAVALSSSQMGLVLRGQHPRHGDVVLKVLREIPPESRDWVGSDTYREVLGNRLLEMGEFPSGESYLLFPYIEGVTLSQAVRRGNVIVGALLDDIVLQTIEHLEQLHGASRPVIHRDVTPGNLIVTFSPGRSSLGGAKCHVSLIDYEAACFVDAAQTALGVANFTPEEQEEGHALLSSDLYALAGTAYFLATGGIPRAQTCKDLRTSFPPGVWGTETRLENLIGHSAFLQCWSPALTERPASAAALLGGEHVMLETRRKGEAIEVRAREMGLFVCGSNLEVELYDRCYRIATPPLGR